MIKQPIVLFIRNGSYWADFSLTAHADRIRKIFGTCVLETPFTICADPQSVLYTVQRHNPEYAVVIRRAA